MLDQTPDLRVSDYAKQALEGPETRQQAADRLLEMAHEDPGLYKALVALMEQTAALRAVNGVVGSQRRAVWSAPQRPDDAAPAASDRLRSATRSNSYTLFDFRLPGTNMPLRDAKRADLIEASRFYRSRADDAAHKARWLDAIADRVGRKRVGNALSESELERLQVEVAE